MPLKNPVPRPFLKWVGGKRQLLRHLLQAIEAAGPFEHYHEPFLGGGALFFALARDGRLKGRSYLSDVNQNLIDTWRGVRDDAGRVIELLNEHKRRHNEAYYYELRARSPRTLASKAARIIYLNKTCYNGLYRENSKGQFNAPFGRYKNPSICDEENLIAVSHTLQEVDLDVRDFTGVLDHAAAGDLVYFDPPYSPISKTAQFTSYSRGGFDAAAQERLAEVFATLDGRRVKVILSNSMTPFVKRLYKGFHIREVMATRSVNSRAERRGAIPEALVTNFSIDTYTLLTGKQSAKIPIRATKEQPVLTEGPWGIAGGKASAVDKRKAQARSRPKKSPVLQSQAVAAHRKGPRLRRWLHDNGYKDVAALIDAVTEKWRMQGRQTRRNWWQVLAGDSKGNPRKVAGREFPVLRVAQLRQGLVVTPNALCRNPDETVPSK